MIKINKTPALASTLSVGSLLAVIAACDGTVPDYSDPVSAMLAPTSVSVVEADPASLDPGGAPLPQGSDYFLDQATLRVYDPLLDFLQDTNDRLCETAFTRYRSFVNSLPYRTQLDAVLCGRLPASSRGEGVDTLIRLYSFMLARVSNSDPQSADFWLPIDEVSPRSTLYGAMDVVAQGSTADRFGDVTMDLSKVLSGGTLMDPARRSTFASGTGESGFRFVQDTGDVDQPALGPGDYSRRIQMVMESDTMLVTGEAKIVDTVRYWDGTGDSGQIVSNWRVVYDVDAVKVQLDVETPTEFDRADFTNHAYSYNLYYATGPRTGDRVELNTGMGVRLASGAYGWVGYDGGYAPYGESFMDGDLVTSANGLKPYTVVKAPGRLYLATRRTLALMQLGLQRFQWQSGMQRYEVAYSGVEWQRVATYNSMTGAFDDLMTPTMIDVAAAGGVLSLWSPFLGPVTYVDGDPVITYQEAKLITGSDPLFANGPVVSLYTTYQGLRGEIDQTEADGGDVFLPTPGNVTNAHRYRISQADMTLYHDVNGDGSVLERVGLDSGVVPVSGPNVSGMQSGPLVLSTAIASMSQTTDVFDESSYYVYETGHNPWNQYVGLVDNASQSVEFDAPIEFLYTHSTLYDLNGDMTYDGQQIVLSYRGSGRLYGIPSAEFDLDGDMLMDRSYPVLSIAGGTIVGPGGAYAVRPMGMEQTLGLDPGGAPQLDPADADPLTVPPITILGTLDLGPMPNLTDLPSVIDGKVQ